MGLTVDWSNILTGYIPWPIAALLAALGIVGDRSIKWFRSRSESKKDLSESEADFRIDVMQQVSELRTEIRRLQKELNEERERNLVLQRRLWVFEGLLRQHGITVPPAEVVNG